MSGMFEVLAASPDEQQLAHEAAADRLAAAVYDVREQFGDFLFQAKTVPEFRNRVALVKDDALRVINQHLMPVTSVVRQVVGRSGALEKEFRARLAGDHPVATEEESLANYEKIKPKPGDVLGGGGGRGGYHPDESYIRGEEVQSRPRTAGESVEVGNVPECDICKYDHGKSGVPAGYDGKTRMGPWANMCEEHFKSHGVGLGTGRGQRLIQRGGQRQACWPGCHENEAHVKKVHKDKEKESRRRQADDRHMAPYEEGHESDWADHSALPNVMPGDPLTDDPHMYVEWGEGPSKGPGRHRSESRRRRAEFDGTLDTDETFDDHQGEELDPEGDFHGYLDDVDQGADAKVDRDFDSTDYASEHSENPATSGDFATASRRRHAAGAGVDDFVSPGAGGSPGGAGAADMTTPTGPMGAGGGDMVSPSSPDKLMSAAVFRQFIAFCRRNRLPAHLGTLERHGRRLSDRDYLIVAAALQRSAAEHRLDEVGGSGKPAINPYTGDDSGAFKGNPEGHGHWDPEDRTPQLARRRTAAPDYLQKADDALTQLLQQKAKEFQDSIVPFQEALQTVQQAEAVAQQQMQTQNGLSVQPPAGTVNVLPESPAGMGLPGDVAGVPPEGADGGQGAPPPAAGDPNAAPPPDEQPMPEGQPMPEEQPPVDPSQMMARRKRGGRPKGRTLA